MRSTQSTSTSEQKKDDKLIPKALKEIGLTGETLERLVKSSHEAISGLAGVALHGPYGKVMHQLGPISKLVEVAEVGEGYDELIEHGHSKIASFIGSGAGVIAESTVFGTGVALTAAGVVAAPEVPPLGATAVTAGVLLMHESEKAGKLARHHMPILVDSFLDKFTDLYSSAAGFVKQSYQKYVGSPELAQRQYTDVESVMLDLGYKEHVRELYKYLDQDQQLIYSTVTRDLFKEYFKLNQDRTINAKAPRYSGAGEVPTHDKVKRDIDKVRGKLLREVEDKRFSPLEKQLREQNKKLRTCISELTRDANQKRSGSSSSYSSYRIQRSDPVTAAQEFCDVLHATSQGVALVSRITGNSRLAQQVTHSAMGVSQVVMGIAQIAKYGWAAGPVGMIFGGMNVLVSCFDSGGDSGMQALAEQLAIISQQIHALHEDMLLQFGKVFTALGIINTNIIQGFRQLHEDHANILVNVMKLQKSVAALQDSINVLGHKIDALGSDLQGYVLEDDRKQLQLVLNDIREKSKRPFNRLKLHPLAMSAFRTFNEELIAKKLNAEKVSSAEISRSLTTKLGSAEANTGLLLNYARTMLGLKIEQPIADPEQWRQTADLLIDMVEKISQEKHDMEVIGEQDYKDFKYLKEIGENWLALIEQFKANPGKANKLGELFHRYRQQVASLKILIEKEIARAEQETKALMPKYQGDDEYKKQQAFKYEFKQNAWFQQHTADGSACKGFSNPARFMGSYCAGWEEHVADRRRDIARSLKQYQVELTGREPRELDVGVTSYKEDYQGKYIRYYKREERFDTSTPRHSASIFLVSETDPEALPMLPLPVIYFGRDKAPVYPPDVTIPTVFIEAEKLNLGRIKHTYKYEKNEFIYKIQFQLTGEEKAILVRQYNKPCTLPDYLNPGEAAWYAYMGGMYPQNGSYTLSLHHQYNNPNGDYWATSYCANPIMGTAAGLRSTFELRKETPRIQASEATEAMIAKKVQQKKDDLRQAMNERIIQQLESLDSRNALGVALTELDASAKMLIAFLSILFRDKYVRPVALWTRNEIIDFVKGYQNQDIYLSHQLEVNLVILDSVEKILLEQLNLQTESAYTPVKNTLKKLAQFMGLYDKHVLKDAELAAKEKAESNKDAVMYGAAQATLMMQTELLNSGHVDAAMHISQLLARSGYGLLSILPTDASCSAQAGYARERLFPAIDSDREKKDEKEIKKLEPGKK